VSGEKPARHVHILLVEDNPGDVRLTKEALKDANVSHQLTVVQDGVAAVQFLTKEGEHAKAARPDLILLDLNLPKRGGREVLSIIKQDASLRRIPVIVLTTSNADDDVMRSYELHANAYIEKPLDMDHFVEVFKAIEAFWCRIVTLPHE